VEQQSEQRARRLPQQQQSQQSQQQYRFSGGFVVTHLYVFFTVGRISPYERHRAPAWVSLPEMPGGGWC